MDGSINPTSGTPEILDVTHCSAAVLKNSELEVAPRSLSLTAMVADTAVGAHHGCAYRLSNFSDGRAEGLHHEQLNQLTQMNTRVGST